MQRPDSIISVTASVNVSAPWRDGVKTHTVPWKSGGKLCIKFMHYRAAAFQRWRNAFQRGKLKEISLSAGYCNSFQLEKRMKNKKKEEEEEEKIEKKKCLLEKKGRKWEKCDIPSPCVRLAGVWHVRLSGDFLPLPPYLFFFLLITPSTSPPSSAVLLYVSFLHYPCSCSTLSYLRFFFSFPHTDTSSSSSSLSDTHTVHLPCVYRKCVLMYSPVLGIYPSLRSRLA